MFRRPLQAPVFPKVQTGRIAAPGDSTTEGWGVKPVPFAGVS